MRQREQERKAQVFDDDIDQQRGADELHEDSELQGVAPERPADLRLDIAALLQGEPTPAELMVAAAGNPVAQSLLQMLRHERSLLDQVMRTTDSAEQGIVYLFGPAEENTVETAEAARIYEQARAYSTDDDLHLPLRLMTPEQIDLLMASDAAWGVGPTYNPKTGEPYSVRGGFGVQQGNMEPESVVSQGGGCDSAENCIAALEEFNITIVTQDTPDENIPSNYTNTMSLAGNFSEEDLQAIYNAMLIMEAAAAELPNLKEYLDEGHEIHIVPMDNIPGLTVTTTPAPLTVPGPTPTPSLIDTAVGRGVRGENGEYRAIELDLNDWRGLNDPQKKSWMVIHEFFEINTIDQGLEFDAGNAPPDIARLVNSIFNEQSDPNIHRSERSFPSRYARTANRLDDFIIEAMTGAVWNRGYDTVEGYDSSAGGRSYSVVGELDHFTPGIPAPEPGPTDPATGQSPTPEHYGIPDELKATEYRERPVMVVRNVRDIGVTVNNKLISLEDFVRVYLFGADPYEE